MPKQKRYKTKYIGVYYIYGTSVANGKHEKIYYILYRKQGKLIEEKAGRQFQDNMTAARASILRASKITGKILSNKELRDYDNKEKNQIRWTLNRLYEKYRIDKLYIKSAIQDKSRYNKYLRDTVGDKETYQIAPLDIDRIRINLQKTHKPQTIKHVLTLLRRIINFGVSKQLCSSLSFRIEMPRVDNIKTEDLTSEQLNRLLEAIEEDTDIQAANFMRVALFTGMRRSEIFRLKWDDVGFERGFIHIRDPKGGPDQNIPLNDATRDLLANHPRGENEYVFPGRNGKQRVDIKRPVNRIKKRAGLPKDFRPLHGLRHVYASMLASSGQVDMYTLQKLLTHKSPLMTQRYAHLRDETLKRASNLVGDIIKKIINQERGG